jgi:HSP20 family protein
MVYRRPNGNLPVGQLRREVDRLFEDFFGPGAAQPRFGTSTRVFPALNIWEDNDGLVAEAELPGVTNENLDIAVVGSEMTIKGRRGETPSETDNVVFHRRERWTGEFSRVVRLPVGIDGDKVQATLKDGVLRVHLPKAESARPHKIPVKAAN